MNNSFQKDRPQLYFINSPSDFAIRVDTTMSPVTFTTVLHISKMRSTGNMMATHAGFNPTDCNTMIIMINPALGTAAEPIDAAAAVNTMVSC